MSRIRHLTRASVVALVALAMAAPAAQAMPAPRSGDGPIVSPAHPVVPYAAHGSRGMRLDVANGASVGEGFQATRPVPFRGAALAARYGSWRQPASAGSAVTTPQSDNGFNGAAAIGAAVVALALAALGASATRMRAGRFAH